MHASNEPSDRPDALPALGLQPWAVPPAAARAATGNRAARRSRRGARPDLSPGAGKVRAVGTSHVPDPRRFTKQRRG